MLVCDDLVVGNRSKFRFTSQIGISIDVYPVLSFFACVCAANIRKCLLLWAQLCQCSVAFHYLRQQCTSIGTRNVLNYPTPWYRYTKTITYALKSPVFFL